MQWIRFIDSSGANTFENIFSCRTDNSNNAYIYGRSASSYVDIGGTRYTGSSGASEFAFIAKMDTSGIVSWVRTMTGLTTAASMTIVNDNIFMSGSWNAWGSDYTGVKFDGTSPMFPIPGGSAAGYYPWIGWIARVDLNGIIQNVRYHDGNVTSFCTGDSSGNMYGTGIYSANPPTLRFANAGTIRPRYSINPAYHYIASDGSAYMFSFNFLYKFSHADTHVISAPAPPVTVNATTEDSRTVVNFYTPSYNGGSDISYYTVSASAPSYATITASGASSPVTLTGLTNSVTYTIRVTATNSSGTSQASTTTVTPRAAQLPIIDWNLWYPKGNDFPDRMEQTADSLFVMGGNGGGGSFVIGRTTASFSSGYYVARMTSSGNLLWNLPMNQGQPYNMVADSSNNLYVIGSPSANITIRGTVYTKPSGNRGSYLMKVNSSGVVDWLTWIDGTGAEEIWGLTLDSSRNIYISGYSHSATVNSDLFIGSTNLIYQKPNNLGGASGFIAKYNSSGIFQYFRWMQGMTSLNDIIYDIESDALGNLYICGQLAATSSVIIGNTQISVQSTTSQSAVIAKLNSSGEYVWAKIIDASPTFEFAYLMRVDASGFVYLNGRTNARFITIDGVRYNRTDMVNPLNGSNFRKYGC
jgi:hypothetical protein